MRVQVGENQGGRRGTRLRRAPGDMRRDHHVVALQQLRQEGRDARFPLEDIQTSPRNALCTQRVDQGLGIHDRPAPDKAISSPLSPPRPLVSTALTVSAASRTASVRLAYFLPSRTAYPAAVSTGTRSGVTPTRARTPIVMSAPSQPQRTRHYYQPTGHHDNTALRDPLRGLTVMRAATPTGALRIAHPHGPVSAGPRPWEAWMEEH